jgi:hypothetical protein
MSARTSITVLTVGAVLTFAVSGHPSFFDVRLTGLILMATGAIGLWPVGARASVRISRSWLRRRLTEIAPVQGTRVQFEELLNGPQRFATDVWAPQAGHQQGVRISAAPSEVTTDDHAGESA